MSKSCCVRSSESNRTAYIGLPRRNAIGRDIYFKCAPCNQNFGFRELAVASRVKMTFILHRGENIAAI